MKAGTIGTGFITTWFIECWQKCEQEVTAVYSRTQEKGQQLADKYHIAKIYTDLEAMLNDEEIDLIYVASPNSLHYEQAKQCLLHNKHVILEKPFTSTVEECEDLIRIANEKHLYLFEGITSCYLPNLEILKEKVKEIAPIHIVTCNMSQYSSKYNAYLKGEKPNVFTTKYSGGALMDLNVYNIHFVTSLFGYPKDLVYIANVKEGVDFGGTITFTYDNELQAILTACKNSFAQSNVQIQGEKGYITIDSASSMLSEIALHKPNQEVEILNNQEDGKVHHYYMRYLLDLMKNDDFEGNNQRLAHTLEVIKIMVKARRSANIIFEADNKQI